MEAAGTRLGSTVRQAPANSACMDSKDSPAHLDVMHQAQRVHRAALVIGMRRARLQHEGRKGWQPVEHGWVARSLGCSLARACASVRPSHPRSVVESTLCCMLCCAATLRCDHSAPVLGHPAPSGSPCKARSHHQCRGPAEVMPPTRTACCDPRREPKQCPSACSPRMRQKSRYTGRRLPASVRCKHPARRSLP